MICFAITIILVGCSPVISQEVFGDSGEIQSDPTSEEIFRLKLQTDDLEDSNQLKTIRNSEEYDVGKILSHLQIVQRPRPVINLRPIGGHTVIHKQNTNKDQGVNHVPHHDEYIPVKIHSDTEYVIKPQHNSHSHLDHGELIDKPGSQDHYYHRPEYNHHGEYNHGYNTHGNGYNHHGHGHNDHVPIHHEYNNHGHNNHEYNNHGQDNQGYNNYEHDNHEYNGHKYPHDTHLNHYYGIPDTHYNHAYKPSTHGSYSHSPRPHIDSHYYNGHYGKPHGDYKPHQGDSYGENGYHQDHNNYGKPHESYHGDYKPHHGSSGGNGYHKPYYHENHDNYGHLHHKYHKKPHKGYDFHHDNHRPYHNGYEFHSNSHSSHDKPHHNYEVHEHEDNSHHHRPSNHHADHKPHKQHNVGHHYSQQSSHTPIDNIHKPREPTHKPHENYHQKPSKPISTHGDPHKYHGPSQHHGSLWKPYMNSVNVHKIDKPKNYQQQNQDEQIKSDLEYLIDENKNEEVIYMEKIDSGSNLHKNTSDNHTKEDSHTKTPTKPVSGSFQIKKNTTHVAMNSHGDKINGNGYPAQAGGHVENIPVTKHENTHKPSNFHNQHTSKPNSHKNKTTPVIITQSNTGNALKPHPMTSYEKPKPILVNSSNRPTISTNHESETQLNLNRPEQKPDHIVPASKPHNSNYYPDEHHNNYYYEVKEPALETLLSSNQDSSSIEENSNVHQQPLIKPNNEGSSEAFVDNSQELISSYENDHNKPHSSIEHVSGHQFNTPDKNHHYHDYEHQNHLYNGEESTDTSGEDHHGTYPQDNVHQSYYPHSHHGNNPHRQQSYSQKPSYNPYHHHGHSGNDIPNKCGFSHEQKLQEYHKEYYRPSYDQQSSHSNHHNYYGKPVNNHHTHQVSKPFNIDHGPYGVSGIFINNFKKRPNSWYDDGDNRYDSQESIGDDYQEDYGESRESYREDSSFEESIEREGKDHYFSQPQASENSGYQRLLNLVSKNSRDGIFDNPHSRRNRYRGSNIFEDYSSNLIPENFVGDFKDSIPSTPGYDLEDKYNNKLINEAEKALAYVINPYAYVSRPHNIVHHNGLQHTTHQNFILDPNHHQHGLNSYIQPHHGHQSNHHEYGIQTPHYHHSLGLETTTHTLSHNPSIHNTGYHDSHVNNHHAHLGTSSHSHESNESPVKYVYIPVLYNFQPNFQEHVSQMSIPILSSNSLSSNLKLNRSNADYFNRLALSELGTAAIYDQKQFVEPTMDIFKAPFRVSPPLSLNTPKVTRESSPSLLEILSSPQPTYLESFPVNEDLNSRVGDEFLRKVETLRKEDELKVENDETRPTSNWHQTQELHEDYTSKCKYIWDSILLAQESGTKSQEQLLFSRSNDEVSTALQDLERKVESLISKKKRSNTLESESNLDRKDSLESTCIEVLKNALLAQLEILDIKRQEEINKNHSQSITKLEDDKEKVSESGVLELETDAHKKNDLPIVFEKEQDGLNDREDEQKNINSSQDYHW